MLKAGVVSYLFLHEDGIMTPALADERMGREGNMFLCSSQLYPGGGCVMCRIRVKIFPVEGVEGVGEEME